MEHFVPPDGTFCSTPWNISRTGRLNEASTLSTDKKRKLRHKKARFFHRIWPFDVTMPR